MRRPPHRSIVAVLGLVTVLLPVPATAGRAAVNRSGVSGGAGFDTCSAPSVSAMQAWWTGTPYRDVGIYIGGESRACSQPNLTAAWITSVHAMGYGLIPIWVGLQAPCSGYAHRMSADPATARTQGLAAADEATAAAHLLGLNRNTIIYDDVEPYPGDVSCQAAVASFMDGWDAGLRSRSYRSGAYGSSCASHLSDWATIPNPPTDVWMANWVTGATSGNTVWNVSCMDNALWNGLADRRLRQFHGDVTYTWNGVTMNVDDDCENGQVAGARHDDEAPDDEGQGGEVEDPSCPFWLPPAAGTGSSAQLPASLAPRYPEGYGRVSTAFAGRLGWMTVEAPHGVNVARADLFASADRGRTWRLAEPVPFDGPLAFSDRATGWAVGSPGSQQLFVSRDAGRTWMRQALPTPAGLRRAPKTVGLPRFFDPSHGVVATWFEGPTASVLQFDVTRDGGRTWLAAGHVGDPALRRFNAGTVVPFSARDLAHWTVDLGTVRLETADGGARWTRVVRAPAWLAGKG